MCEDVSASLGSVFVRRSAGRENLTCLNLAVKFSGVAPGTGRHASVTFLSMDTAGRDVRHVKASTHGRYLVRAPETAGPWPLLIGFHGYGENAPTHLEAVAGIPGIEGWLVAAVQALH